MASRPAFSVSQIARLRLQALGLAGRDPVAPGPSRVVSHHLAMQGQDFPASRWAVGSRLPDSTDSDVLAAFDRGEMPLPRTGPSSCWPPSTSTSSGTASGTVSVTRNTPPSWIRVATGRSGGPWVAGVRGVGTWQRVRRTHHVVAEITAFERLPPPVRKALPKAIGAWGRFAGVEVRVRHASS